VKQIILARRYAKALFAVGKEDGKLDDYSEALQGLAGLYATDSGLADALTNPLYPLDVREKVMEGVVASIGVDKIMSNFLNLLVEKKRADVLPDIAEEFQIMVDEEKNVSHGTVVSAVELSKELQAKVQATLEKLTGKKVELSASIDASIIGGVIAKVGDLELDGSIRTQLAGLKDSIKGRE
jgi:F-type H+-transporting ATPase subunit delta